MKKLLLTIGFIGLSLVVFLGCKKSNSDSGIQSRHNGTTSHNNGEICTTCHQAGGSASEYKWVMAGSVYNETGISMNPNGMIYLWTGVSGNGDLKATLEVDGKGNFFTTYSVIPSGSVYPQVINAAGTGVKNMPLPVTTGNCNGCHGVSTGKIWVP